MSIHSKISSRRKKKHIKKPEGVSGMSYQDYLDKQGVKTTQFDHKGLAVWKSTKGKKLKMDWDSPKTMNATGRIKISK